MISVIDSELDRVFQAMSTMLGFGSTILARMDMSKGGAVLSISPRGPEPASRFRQAIDVLGFDPSGAVFPMWADDALFVRCYHQGRLLATTSLRGLIGSALPADVVGPIDDLVGPKLYVGVPVLGTSGTVLAVIILERDDVAPLTSDERDRLLLYADRVGQLLESDRLGEPVLPPAAASSDASPVNRWLSVHLLDRRLRPLWSGGAGPGADAVVGALGGRVLPGTREVILPDGAAVLVHVNAVDPSGHVAWLLLCEDLAGRDREVRDLREQLRLHLAGVQEAVIRVDAELRVTGCNAAVRDVLGAEPAALVGEPVTNFLPGKAVSPTHRRLAGDLLAAGHVERQLRLQRRDGAAFPAELSILLQLDETERPVGAVATVRDLTEQRRQAAERHRLQRKLLRSERLAALGEMAARIAHEVRNPLAAIAATALAIEEEAEAEGSARERAAAIGAEVRRLDGILTDLLRFAKPRQPVREVLDLAELVRQALAIVRVDPLADGVEFELRVEREAARLQASVDPDGMRQVLINVLRNAAEACGSDGRVACRIGREGATIRLDIEDTGGGVSPQTLRRAFEPFYSTKSRGTGLGLPISRRIVEEHGGKLRLGSTEGRGTTVTIELPAEEQRRGASRPKEARRGD